MIRNVIAAWSDRDARLFERSTPLQFAGDRNRKLGYENDFDVVFLYGLETLDTEYKEALRNLGFRLHDASSLYAKFRSQYRVLERFGSFELNCFLRWLVLSEFFSGERIIHYDGDVVHNEHPRRLAEKIDGSTFVLQGCPALTAISNPNWFSVYRKQIDPFAADIFG